MLQNNFKKFKRMNYTKIKDYSPKMTKKQIKTE